MIAGLVYNLTIPENTTQEGKTMAEVSLKGVCDMHVHTNPDLRLRAYNDFELADAAIRVGARAIVIKSHQGFTANRAFLTNEYVRRVHGENTGFTMYGSVTLNKSVGGINPSAVITALKLGAKVVWLPTQSAKNHIRKMGNDPAAGVDIVSGWKVVPMLNEIFRMIVDYDAVLGTAHCSPEEAFVVIEAARNAGVRKIVLTHPEWWIVGMSHDDQVRIVKNYDVILERCYAQNMGGGKYKSNLPDNLEIIRKVGYKNVMVDTDGGQTENPHWEVALKEYMQYLADNGIPEEQIYHMTRTIPYELLGLKEGE